MQVRERRLKKVQLEAVLGHCTAMSKHGVRVGFEVKSQQGHSLSFYEGVHRNKQTNKQSFLGHQAQVFRWTIFFRIYHTVHCITDTYKLPKKG